MKSNSTNKPASARHRSWAPASFPTPTSDRSSPAIAMAAGAQRTAAPLATADDWLRLPKAGQTLYGMTRTFLYVLCKQGKIRSVSLKQPHNQRGIRLLWKPSIEAFLAEQDRSQNGAQPDVANQ